MVALADLALVWAAMGVDCCLLSAMLAFNVWGLIGFVREEREEKPSGVSMAAWGIGFLSLLLGPCAWLGAVIAIGMASFERRRIYQDKSPLSSAGPARMASINGGFTLLIWVLMLVAGIGQYATTGG
ncbi:MAG: hypothetical protein ACI8PZ_001531 [Myxococcota bacterium]|jgi:hypothetical protein